VANINITSPGTYEVGDGDKAKIKDPGGDVTLVAPTGDDNVDKITIEFEKNDGIADKVIIDLSTFDEDGLHIDVKEYDPSDEIVLLGATITGVDPSDSSHLEFTYVGEDGSTYTGYIHLKDKGEKDWTDPDSPIIICFAKDTQILTDHGKVAVQDLRVGDLVVTKDNGTQPIRWIGSRTLEAFYLATHPNLRPVRIKAKALGQHLPCEDLVVSPQHRMLVGGAMAQLLFGCDEVLIAAKHLINDHSIGVDHKMTKVTYFHILFDSHQVVFANDAPSESLFPSDMAISALDQIARAEVVELFPNLDDQTKTSPQTALPVLESYEARVLQAFCV